MAIDFIEEEDKLKSRKMTFTLMPEAWQEFIINQDLFPCIWKIIKLNEEGKNNLDLNNESGIYTLIVQPGIALHPACSYLMYVGQTHNLRHRFLNYLRTEKKKRIRPNIYRLLNIYDNHIWFCFTKVDSDKLDEYENVIMNAYIPPINDENRLPAKTRRFVGAF